MEGDYSYSSDRAWAVLPCEYLVFSFTCSFFLQTDSWIATGVATIALKYIKVKREKKDSTLDVFTI